MFNARVFDFYSMAERVAYAAQCEHGRMHVNPEYGVLEIVDEHGRATDAKERSSALRCTTASRR